MASGYRDTDDTEHSEAETEQARLFIVQLEDHATRLEQQVTALEKTANIRIAKTAERLRIDARLRRAELYEARRHIDALYSRYPRLTRMPTDQM